MDTRIKKEQNGVLVMKPINCMQLHGRTRRTAHGTSEDRLGFMGCSTVPSRPKTSRAAVRHYPAPRPDRGAREAVRSGQAGGAAPPSTVEAEPATSGLAAVCRHAGRPTLPYCLLRHPGFRLLLIHALRAVPAPPPENRRTRETSG